MKYQICRIALAAAAVTTVVFLSACGLFRDTTDSVFDNAEDAISTDRAASDIETAQFEYEFGDGRTSTIRFQAPGKVRIDVLDGKKTAVFCLNGASGWIYMGGEVFNMSADDIKEMHGALLLTIPFNVNFQSIFTDAVLQETLEDVCGEECNVIHAVLRREPDARAGLWVGKSTGLLRQLEIVRKDDGEPAGEAVYMMQYFNYKDYDGITLPTQMFRFAPNGATKLSLISFETNIDIPAYVFRKPERLSAVKGEER